MLVNIKESTMRTRELGSQPGHGRRDGDSWGLSHG